jgi:hypothetical protein
MCLHLGVIYAYLGNPLGYLYKSSNLVTWEITYPKAFPRATNPKTIYFNDKLFSVLDSYEVQGVSFNSNHLWESSDLGATWRCTNSNMPMGKLGESAVTVFKDKIYVIGGKNEAGVNQSSVWASSDGISWNLETADGGFTARRSHAVCVLGDELIISGGIAGSSTNDVWSSSDGKVWVRIAITSAWSARNGHKMINVRNKLYLFEGVDNASSPLHDSWESIDKGVTWTEVNSNFLGTYYQVGACNFYGTLAFLGGATANLSEVTGKMYTSLNGDTKEETPIVSGNSIPARQRVTLLVVGPKIYALGGRTLSTLSGLDSVYEGTCPIKSITASPASRVSRGTVDIQWFSLSPDLVITPSLGTVEKSVDTKLVDFKKTKRYRII